MNRTIRVQLHPTPEQAQVLKETLRQFTDAFNAVCTYGWQHAEKNGVKLHHATYYQMREHFPRLNANVLIQARVKATEALKSAFTWKARHEASYPNCTTSSPTKGKSVVSLWSRLTLGILAKPALTVAINTVPIVVRNPCSFAASAATASMLTSMPAITFERST